MSDEPLDELFFNWLYSRVAVVDETDPRRTYWGLLRKLYSTECVWVVINDGNRLEDGRDLRLRFRDDSGIQNIDPSWIDMACSFFELMVGLSDTLAFEADGKSHNWFWKLMENIGLDSFNDDVELDEYQIEEVTHRVIFRLYGADGSGGFFPLQNPRNDQRVVELWGQMSAYILELP